MSLIPYPNVPALPGVPALNRSSSSFVGAALNVVAQVLPNNLFGTKWGILDGFGATLLKPDSFVSFEYREERKIPNYPIEDGSFRSYNKVALPYDIKLTVTCSGNGSMTKINFINTIQKLLDELTIINVSTPEKNFEKTNLIHVDYRKEARNGATLIIAQLWFQEIKVAQMPSVSTTQPSGTPKTPLGQLSPVTPTSAFGTFNPSASAIGIK
jgi:hypothetical protein